ncbi:MAG TPA: ester cyclase [Beijerinckiaceae bacterium]|nr:ester cyclase [Beijerinckiaceae bacterium]
MTVHAVEASRLQIQKAKALVWDLWKAWQTVTPVPAQLPEAAMLDEAVAFHGPAPLGLLTGRDQVLRQVYAPIANAFPLSRREPHLFLGGQFEGHVWVATTGYISGAMAGAWLGIPAGSGERRLRFGEFYRIENGRIVEIRCLFDILGLAAQAGYQLLPPFQGRAEPPPGPALGNGIALGEQDPEATRYTLQLVEDMLGGCNRLNGSDLSSMGMAAYWHEDMVWHGPWGVGSSYGFREFQEFAQGPSVASFPNRRGGFHRARFADGLTAAFTGWPSLRGDFTGKPFRGIAPTGGPIGQNIMDFYVRRDDRLHENWILIDLIDFARQCGVDLLAPLQRSPAARP